jgi:hypothetical protein
MGSDRKTMQMIEDKQNSVQKTLLMFEDKLMFVDMLMFGDRLMSVLMIEGKLKRGGSRMT